MVKMADANTKIRTKNPKAADKNHGTRDMILNTRHISQPVLTGQGCTKSQAGTPGSRIAVLQALTFQMSRLAGRQRALLAALGFGCCSAFTLPIRKPENQPRLYILCLIPEY